MVGVLPCDVLSLLRTPSLTIPRRLASSRGGLQALHQPEPVGPATVPDGIAEVWCQDRATLRRGTTSAVWGRRRSDMRSATWVSVAPPPGRAAAPCAAGGRCTGGGCLSLD